LPSGGYNSKLPNYSSEWEYLRTIGIKLGVPEIAILKENKARHTFENAELSWAKLQNMHIAAKRVILVCKAYHSRRALLTYQSVFPSDVNFFVSPVVDMRGIARILGFQTESISTL
jgi:uncharacterized SAM-binding protein YcdF (DUF218 family)